MECLVRTAAEAEHGDVNDLSDHQIEVAQHAHDVLHAEDTDDGSADSTGELVDARWTTTVEHWASIPVAEIVAAAHEETDPVDYVTADGRLTPDAMTGTAIGAFSDLLGRYELVSEKQIVRCLWGSEDA